jgi:hypothetical protein
MRRPAPDAKFYYRWTYLPTGATGIRAFDQDPVFAEPHYSRLGDIHWKMHQLVWDWNRQHPTTWQYSITEETP